MKRAYTVIMFFILVMLIGGCGGTIDLNKTITGTECVTREDCLKDLKYSGQDKGDIVIVIEPYHINSWSKNYLGYRPLDSGNLQGDIDVCLFKAIKDKIPTSTVLFGGKEITGDIHISIQTAGMDATAPGTPRWYIDYVALIKGKEVKDRAAYVKVLPWSVSSFSSYAYPAVCDALITKVLAELK